MSFFLSPCQFWTLSRNVRNCPGIKNGIKPKRAECDLQNSGNQGNERATKLVNFAQHKQANKRDSLLFMGKNVAASSFDYETAKMLVN